jgi:transaldolase/glucose-6-phosphate isomerase
MATNPLTELVARGQSPWIDFIRRSFMTSGELGKLIAAGEIRGATSNPTIFEKAIGGSDDYDDQLSALVRQGVTDPKKIFDELAIQDIQMAADILSPVYQSSNGTDGFISLEVSPAAANDTQATLDEARYLWNRVSRPNVMIKVPATPEGIPAIRQLVADGLNINITLIFALDVYKQVAQAYIEGLERRVEQGLPINAVASVASFFVSRVDTETDKRLEALAQQQSDPAARARILGLRGKAAIANAKLAYEEFQQIFHGGERFAALQGQGAQVQRCLWASTSTKNPAYRDVLYVEELIGPETVDTMPPATIDAFRDHGQVRLSLTEDVAGAHALLRSLEEAGISMDDVTYTLQIDGVKLFAASYSQLLDETGRKVASLQAAAASSGMAMTEVAVSARLGSVAGGVSEALSALDAAHAGERLWQKDATFWKDDPEIGSKIRDRLGWLDVARYVDGKRGELERFAREIQSEGFTHAVLLGMGGSSLCPEVLTTTFGSQPGFPRLIVLDSTDPDMIHAVERQIDLPHTLFIVASKSGTTLETLSHCAYFYEQVRAIRQEPGRQFIAITDPGTPLEAQAGRMGFRQVFRNPPDIGGRYSALSYFGMVPAAVLGMPIGGTLRPALALMSACGPEQPAAQNPGLWLGAVMGAAAKSGRDKVTIVASPPIASVGLWIEQLIAESTGKEGRGILPVAMEPLGAPDTYGHDRLFAYLRTASGFDPQQDAALEALAAAGHPVVRFDLPSPAHLTGEFFRWEVATAVAGHFLGINPFDEPNVQESKDNTKRILGEFEQSGKLPELTPALTAGTMRLFAADATAQVVEGASTAAQALDAVVRLGHPGDYIAIMAYIQPTDEHDRLLQLVRERLRERTHLATTLGYGPRFLHSTGQLHKGGPNTGIFVQIVAADQSDAAIPGQPFTFGTLIQAQSLGDYQSLQAHGRRVVRVDLDGDISGGLARLAE